MRRVLVGATLVLVAGMTTGCGGSPDDASKEDFCKAWTNTTESDKQEEFDKQVDKVKEVGTPKGISKDAREGYETVLELFEEVDIEDDEAGDKLLEDLDKADEENVQKFFEYQTKTCAPAGG